MNELALRTLLNNLEASRTSLHGLLHIFTWFVVFGLGFDLFVIIKEFRDDWREFRYGQIRPYENHLPKRPSAWLLILALLGTALIVIGVAGELYVDVQAGKIETQIREANDELLGLVIKEAGDAVTSAKTAHDEATAASEAAGKAQGKAAHADASSLEAERHATQIGNELAKEVGREQEAEQQLEAEKQKRLKLAVSLRDRELFDQSGIVAKLSSLPPHRIIFVYLNEYEPRRFAEQIAFVFSSLKWPFVGRPIPNDSGLFAGVSVICGHQLARSGSSTDNMRRFGELEAGQSLAEVVRKIFADAHVELAANQFTVGSSIEPPSTLLIGVGPKPNAELEQALKELGMPTSTPFREERSGATLIESRNRVSIPLDPTFKP